jgi:hypothetical protein
MGGPAAQIKYNSRPTTTTSPKSRFSRATPNPAQIFATVSADTRQVDVTLLDHGRRDLQRKFLVAGFSVRNNEPPKIRRRTEGPPENGLLPGSSPQLRM